LSGNTETSVDTTEGRRVVVDVDGASVVLVDEVVVVSSKVDRVVSSWPTARTFVSVF
jgi:hypothetical protein